MTDAREMAKMLDLRAGRGCCLTLAWSQRPIDRQNLGTSPFLGISRLGILRFSPCPTPYSHLVCLGGKAKVRRNMCLVYSLETLLERQHDSPYSLWVLCTLRADPETWGQIISVVC
jgi:hypothetical protein